MLNWIPALVLLFLSSTAPVEGPDGIPFGSASLALRAAGFRGQPDGDLKSVAEAWRLARLLSAWITASTSSPASPGLADATTPKFGVLPDPASRVCGGFQVSQRGRDGPLA